MSILSTRPDTDECSAYYYSYIQLAPNGDIIETLQAQQTIIHDLLHSAAASAPAAPEAWSLNQNLAHISDAERLFTFRALWFARGEQSALPGMDPDLWMANIDPGARTLPDLLAEFDQVRAACIALFAGLPAAAWSRRGTASGQPVSVRALAWIAAGHAQHHINSWREQHA